MLNTPLEDHAIDWVTWEGESIELLNWSTGSLWVSDVNVYGLD